MIFSVHYFLWFSALTSIYGYMSVYADHYANTSATQYGLLNMVLPFLSIMAKIFFCSMADRYHAHKKYFITFLAVATIGYGSFAVLPLIIEPRPKDQGLYTEVWVIICVMAFVSNIAMAVLSCFSDAFAVNQARREGGSYGRIRVWGTIGWGLTALAISYINQYQYLPKLEPGLLLMAELLILDLVFVSLWPNKEDFRLDKSISEIDNDDAPNLPIDSISTNSANIVCKSNNEMQDVTTFIATNSNEHSLSLDESCNISASSSPQVYGSTSNGTATNICLTNVCTSDDKRIQHILPEQKKKKIGVKIQFLILTLIFKDRKSLIRFMILFILSGTFISMQWSYFFLYLEKIYGTNFEFTSGLSMVGQSMLGELPFFILSRKFIECLGRSVTLSVSFMTIGLRYLLYIYLLPNSNVYYVLATEWLQGPNFGLFYVVMTEVGAEYSECNHILSQLVGSGHIENNNETIEATRSALKATMQALVSACYEGLGIGIGSIIGGAIIDSYGFPTLWSVTAYLSIGVGILNMLYEGATYYYMRSQRVHK
ncbi:hypothetical protein GZH46_02864 [Fragariocoptes setiger]|uniref:Major facilitator superfamily associated domain-containing protein n=1 Tax=Fragariocoptes setiger TaxID=1670756 RepID=A0ABQ7S5D7_9ACAR|nr:hypothetical protein GZH46_02864 [Fragariocoptes setiger]